MHTLLIYLALAFLLILDIDLLNIKDMAGVGSLLEDRIWQCCIISLLRCTLMFEPAKMKCAPLLTSLPTLAACLGGRGSCAVGLVPLRVCSPARSLLF